MAMDKDSRVEIMVAVGVLIVILLIWFRNQQAGQGTGLSVALPAIDNGSTNSGVPLSLTLPNQTPPVSQWLPPGLVSTVTGSPSYSFANPSSCGCGGGSADNTYGGANDLAAALLAQGYDAPFIDPNSGNGVF